MNDNGINYSQEGNNVLYGARASSETKLERQRQRETTAVGRTICTFCGNNAEVDDCPSGLQIEN
jgi:hypothetical protein